MIDENWQKLHVDQLNGTVCGDELSSHEEFEQHGGEEQNIKQN